MTTYLVSGYMRTGTSMMMEALIAGGLEAVYSPERQTLTDQWGGDGYVPNEEYYELPYYRTKVAGFPRMYEGKLLKILYGGISDLAPLSNGLRVVFMRRDPEEIRQSEEAFFKRQKAPLWLCDGGYERRMDLAMDHLHNRRDVLSVTELQYRDVLADPLMAFNLLRGEGWPIDVAVAALVVDPAKCRFRLEELEVGI